MAQSRMDAHSDTGSVTPGVAGSSPVRSAKFRKEIIGLLDSSSNPIWFLEFDSKTLEYELNS